MKSNFDLTPIARNGANAFVARICMCALLVAVPLWLWQRSAFAHGVLCGVLAGTIDLSILFLGIKKSLPYVEVPKQGLKIMKRFRWARLAAAAAFIITMPIISSGEKLFTSLYISETINESSAVIISTKTSLLLSCDKKRFK